MNTVLTKNQKKLFKKDIVVRGQKMRIIATVRHDDECGNGNNSFSITGEIYEYGRDGRQLKREPWTCGCIHKDVEKHFSELAPFIKWHLCSTDGPMHYIANTVYHASDKDCWGLRKGEKRQIRNGRTGELAWVLSAMVDGEVRSAAVDGVKQYVHSNEQPPAPADGLFYAPWYKVGEGKEPDIDAARRCAIWPEASLEQLTDKGALMARLPALMEEFKTAVESLGLTF